MSRRATVALVLSLLSHGSAEAVDLTTLDATATIQSVIFSQGDNAPPSSMRTGFLRIQAANVEQGFNTDFRPLEPDAIGLPTQTRSIRFSSLQRRLLTTPAGSDYFYELYLDVNESTISGGSFLSIDQLRVYSSDNPSIATVAALNSSAVLHYDLDVPTNQELLLDSALEPGSGIADLTIQIPTSYFAGAPDTAYMYVFFRAGGAGIVGARNYGSSGGFEEMLGLLPSTPTSVETAATTASPSIRASGNGSGQRLTFRVSVPGSGRASITLYDVRGRRVGVFERTTNGPTAFETDLAAFRGHRHLAAGIYLYRFDWNGMEQGSGKVALLR